MDHQNNLAILMTAYLRDNHLAHQHQFCKDLRENQAQLYSLDELQYKRAVWRAFLRACNLVQPWRAQVPTEGTTALWRLFLHALRFRGMQAWLPAAMEAAYRVSLERPGR